MTQRGTPPPPSSGGAHHCRGCRSPLADDQRYCLNCGAEVRDVVRDLLPARSPALPPPPLAPRRRLRPLGGVRRATAALACSLGLGILAGALAGPVAPKPSSGARRVVVMASTPVAPPASSGEIGPLQAFAPPPSTPPAPPSPPPPPPPPAAPTESPSKPEARTKTKERKQDTPATSTNAPAKAKEERVPIKHVVVVALAEKGFGEAFGPRSQAPYLATELRRQGLLLRRYHATAHGSLPNLTGLLSGQGANPEIAAGCPALTPFVVAGRPAQDGQVRGKGCVFGASVTTLPAQLEADKLAWRAYVEGADQPPGTPPGPCQPPAPAPDGSLPGLDRNPFLFFAGIAGAADCTTRVTGLAALAADLTGPPAQAPALSVVLPDACHAGREATCPPGEPDGLVRADAWLREWVPQLLAAPAYADDTMIVITFDQARAAGPRSDFTSCCGQERGVNEPESVDPQAAAEGGGRVGALVLSPRVTAGRVSDVPYNHFALLRTIERAFGLDLLGFAADDALEPFGSDVFGAAGKR